MLINYIEGPTQEVARGSDDQLFLVGGNQSVLSYVTGEKQVLEAAKRNFKQTLTDRRVFCQENQVTYAHIVCPDKHTVYNEKFPFEVKVAVGEEFKRYCGDLISYSVDEFRRVPGGSYMRTDTHWNVRGEIEFARQALNCLSFPPSVFEGQRNAIEQLIYSQPNYAGDLGRKLDPIESETRLRYKNPEYVAYLGNNVTGNNGAIFIAINSRQTSGRLLLFGDSFAISALGLLSIFFREVLLIRSPFFHREIAAAFRPSHILTSNVERYLPNMPVDRDAPLALLYAGILNKEMKPDELYFEALNALLSPDRGFYDRFMPKLAVVS